MRNNFASQLFAELFAELSITLYWFVARCNPKQEHYAAAQLQAQSIEYFLPAYRHKTLDRHYFTQLLFNNYIFIKANPISWPTINSIFGIHHVITFQPEDSPFREPTQLPSNAIESLQQQVLEKEKEQYAPTKQLINPGCYVKILNGPLALEKYAQRALVQWADKERAILLLEMFKRDVKMTFYHKDLQLVS